MYIVIVVCITAVIAIFALGSLLRTYKKSGANDNEIKRREIASKTLETIRKVQAHSSTLTREQRNKRMLNNKPCA